MDAGNCLIIKSSAKPTKQRFLRRQQISDGMAGNRPLPQIVLQILLVVSEGNLVKKRLRIEHLLELIVPVFATSLHDERADGDQAGFMRRQLLPGDAAFLAFGVKLRTQRNQVEIPLLRFGEQDEPAGGSALLPGDVDLTTEDRLNALFPAIPPGTLLANLLGGYLIGLALAFFAAHPGLSPEWRLLVVTGFLGGLTTFSTFSAEIIQLLQQQRPGTALAAMALHVAGSLLMTALGLASHALLRSGA